MNWRAFCALIYYRDTPLQTVSKFFDELIDSRHEKADNCASQ
jgi:hypothetical protein